MNHKLTANTNWDTLSPSPGDNIFLNGFALNLVGGTGVHSNQFDLGSGTISATSDGNFLWNGETTVHESLTEGTITNDYTAFCVYDDAVLTANLRSGRHRSISGSGSSFFAPLSGSTLTINGNITAIEVTVLEVGSMTIKVNGVITGGSAKLEASAYGISVVSSLAIVDLSGTTIYGGSNPQPALINYGLYVSSAYSVDLTNVIAIGGDASAIYYFATNPWTGAIASVTGGTSKSSYGIHIVGYTGIGTIITAQGTIGAGIYQNVFTGTLNITNCNGGNSERAYGCISYSTGNSIFNIENARGGTVTGAYGFYCRGGDLINVHITNSAAVSEGIVELACYLRETITLTSGNNPNNWATCKSGSPPAAGDDIVISSNAILTLDVCYATYTCFSIVGPGSIEFMDGLDINGAVVTTVTINANLRCDSTKNLLTVGEQTVTINGDVTGGYTAYIAVKKTGGGIITINGLVTGAGSNVTVSLENSTGLFTINNGTKTAILGNSSGVVPVITGISPMSITGNICGWNNTGLTISSSAVTIIGDILHAGSSGNPSLLITGEAIVHLTGNIYANDNTAYGCSITGGATFTCIGEIIASTGGNAALHLNSSSAIIDLTNCKIFGGGGSLSYGVLVSAISSINLSGTIITGGFRQSSHGIYYNSTTAWIGTILSATGGTNSASGIYINSAITSPISIETAQGGTGIIGQLSFGEIRQDEGGPGVYQASTTFDNTLSITNCYGGNSYYAFGCLACTTSAATFNIGTAKGGSVSGAYGFFNCGTTTPTIATPDESGIALYYNKTLLLSGSLSWSTCNGGQPPAITDDLILTPGCTLQLDESSEYVYQCSSIKGPGYLTFGSSSTVIITANLFPTTTNSMLTVVNQTVTINGDIIGGMESGICGIRKTGTGVITVNGKLIGSCGRPGTEYNLSGSALSYAVSLESPTGLFTVNAITNEYDPIGTALIGRTSTPIKLWASTPININGNIFSDGSFGLYITRDSSVTVNGKISNLYSSSTCYGLYVSSELATIDLTGCTIDGGNSPGSGVYIYCADSVNLTNSTIVGGFSNASHGLNMSYLSSLNLTGATIIGGTKVSSAAIASCGISMQTNQLTAINLTNAVIIGGKSGINYGISYTATTAWTGTILSVSGRSEHGIYFGSSSATGTISINTAQGGTHGSGITISTSNCPPLSIINCYGRIKCGGSQPTSIPSGCYYGASNLSTVNITNARGGDVVGYGLKCSGIQSNVSITNFDNSKIGSPVGFSTIYKIPTTSHLVFKDNSNNPLNAYGEGTLPVNSDVKKNTVYAISNVGTLNTNYAY